MDALLSAQNSAQIDITNRYLEQVNEVIQAADTYLIDRFGNTIASSNWNLDRSFIGRNFAWRPYFYLSIAGQKSQYFALGSTSGQRGYYYAYPVIYAAEILGVIVVKMDLSAIEQGWQSKSSYFVATDDHQVVFMSSQPAWLFHSVADLSPAQLNDIRQSQQYLDSPIPSLGWQATCKRSKANGASLKNIGCKMTTLFRVARFLNLPDHSRAFTENRTLLVGVWLSDYSLHVVCDCVFGFSTVASAANRATAARDQAEA